MRPRKGTGQALTARSESRDHEFHSFNFMLICVKYLLHFFVVVFMCTFCVFDRLEKKQHCATVSVMCKLNMYVI